MIKYSTKNSSKQYHQIIYYLVKAYAHGRKIAACSSRCKKIHYYSLQNKSIVSVLADGVYLIRDFSALAHFNRSCIFSQPGRSLFLTISLLFSCGHRFILRLPSGLLVIYLLSVAAVSFKYGIVITISIIRHN